MHIDQMVQLAALTRPGPFGKGTIKFGSYYGIFDGEKLVSMTGQRLHIENFSEISAVCTHPDYTGKGYARTLLLHQLGIILQAGQQPFLHVREDNTRAIELYQRLGFKISRKMNFYFMKRL
jgi:predicted GNAT family acetyltransferase